MAIINAIGLYTEKQMEEKRERITELWDALNECVCAMEVYSGAIAKLAATGNMSGNVFGIRLTEEERMSIIAKNVETILQVSDKNKIILTTFKEADWS